MSAQPPAAPETDVRLTEAERDSLRVVLARWFKSENRVDAMMQRHVIPAVERIVAERVRVVEGERDAARADAAHADHVTDTLIERAQRIGMSVRAADPSRYAGWTEDQWAADAVQIMDSIDGSCADLVNGHVHALIRKAARAESAEAAHAAMVKVLGEYFDFDVDPWDDHDAACPAPEDVWRLHRDLRALLPGGAR